MKTNFLKRFLLKGQPWKISPIRNKAMLNYFEETYDATSLEPIKVGHSKDRKFIIRTKNDECYFLRVASLDKKSLIERIFAVRKELFRIGCLSNVPIAVGTCPEGCYLLEPWLTGNTLPQRLPTMKQEEQYELGKQVGMMYLRFHEVSFPKRDLPPLSDSFTRTLNKFKKTEHELFGYKETIVCGIEDALRKMSDRPSELLHGDFHLNNIILDETHTPVVIDFEAVCVGDPLFDCVTIMDNYHPPYPYRWFNQGFSSAFPDAFSESDWEIMAAYFCFRKLNEYLVFHDCLNERLSSPSMWKMYCDFMRHPLELKKWLLG